MLYYSCKNFLVQFDIIFDSMRIACVNNHLQALQPFSSRRLWSAWRGGLAGMQVWVMQQALFVFFRGLRLRPRNSCELAGCPGPRDFEQTCVCELHEPIAESARTLWGEPMADMNAGIVFGTAVPHGLSLLVSKGLVGPQGFSLYVMRHHRQLGGDGDVVSFEQHLSFRSFEEVELWVACDPLKNQYASTFDSVLRACADIFIGLNSHEANTHWLRTKRPIE